MILQVKGSQIKIFHQPRFPWNKEISRNLSYLLGWKLVWGRYNLTRGMYIVFQPPFSGASGYVSFKGVYFLTDMQLVFYADRSRPQNKSCKKSIGWRFLFQLARINKSKVYILSPTLPLQKKWGEDNSRTNPNKMYNHHGAYSIQY